jgi:16S rRNA (cytosine967-C5)-methyltransferase
VLPKNAPLQDLIDAGLCFVQDEASQIAVAALGATVGARVADLCAAPGSKSFGAALSVGKTGAVHSFDLDENKLSLIRTTAEKLGLTHITVAAGDARNATPDTHGTFPFVICDVPCSGFGVLAKKPDIRYKNIAEAAGLLPVQRDILAAAATLVEPGGVLLYSTCTLLPQENEEQVMAFLATHPAFSPEPFSVGGIASSGLLTLAPDTHGTDGFFVAKLRKKEQ